MCFPGSGGDKEGAFDDRPRKGHRGVKGEQASLQESEPNDWSHRQNHPGAGEGQGHPGWTDGQWNHPACRVRAEDVIQTSALLCVVVQNYK